MNRDVVLIAAGIAVGFVAARFLTAPGTCCDRVEAAVRDKVGAKLGSTVVAVGDALDIWGYTPGLLDLFGVSS